MKRLTDWYFNSLKKQILIPFLALIMIASIIPNTFSNFDEIKKMMNDMVNEVTLMESNPERLNSISQETAAGTEEVSASVEQTNASMEQLNALASELDALSQEMHKERKKFTF
ncbi:methyl-accepting chemotaxis protein [Peribacillus simplex]|uniref:methyl-accepting chemotaxis protein n=1 Tax=Peribacillus simplex TaxID=1478 RepID=UPI00119D6A66|nr:methyl-accepting chemotaxis protein [Peribacillus simplex]